MKAEQRYQPLKSHNIQRKLLDDYYAEVKQAQSRGIKTCYAIGHAPTDLAVAMGFLPVYPENHNTMCGAAQVGAEICEVAEAHGYSMDLCSYSKCDLGSSLAGPGTKSPIGGLPKPDILMATTVCNTHLKWFEELSRIWHVPLLVLDVPYFHDGLSEEDRAAGVQYTVRQLKEEWIPFFESYCHRPYDWDKLQECMGYTSKTGQLYAQVVNSCKNKPSPLTVFDTFLLLGALMNLRGYPQAVSFYEQLNAEIAERVERKFSAVGEEKYRLYFDNIPVWYKVGWFSRKFTSYGACMVAAVYSQVWIRCFGQEDPARPLESIAETQFLLTTNQGTMSRINLLNQICRDFSVDGLVMQVSRTCKVFIPDQIGIMKQVQEETGLPGVIIEADMIDSRFFSEKEADSLIDGFMEILRTRKV
jgi:bcr-type benzoyl-CoA reductase subunit B